MPLPPDCSIDAIIDWLCEIPMILDDEEPDYLATARAVRELVEVKCRQAAGAVEIVFHPTCEPLTDKSLDFIAASVLGSP